MSEINIIIPTYNEEDNIIYLIKDIFKYVPKSIITIVDDSKNNLILSLIKKENFKTKVNYFHRKNSRGRGSAVLFGFKKVIKNNVKQTFIEMDADFSHKPSELRKNIKMFNNNFF